MEFYSELWFIMLMAVLGLILLFFLSLILQRKIRKEPYIRERPLVPLPKANVSIECLPTRETHVVCS